MPPRPRPVSFLLLGTFACIGIHLLYRLVLVRQTSPELGGIEHSVIYHLQRLLDGQPLYGNPELPPFPINQYGPLYYGLVAAVARLAGVQSDEVLALFAWNRTVSLVLNLAYAGLVFTFAQRIFHTGRAAAFVVAGLSFVFLEPTSFARPDSLSHLLLLWCFYLFCRWIKHPTRVRLFACAALCAASLFSKQNAFVAPLVCGAWLAGQRQFRTLLHFSAAFLASFAVFLGLAGLLFGISSIWKNLVLGVNNGMSLNWYYDQILKKLFSSFGLVFLLCALLHWKLRNADPLARFCNTALLLLFGCATLLALKWGSTNGYYTEWWTLVLIATAALWRTQAHEGSPLAGALPWFAATLLLVRTALTSYPLIEATRASIREEQARNYQADLALCNRIRGFLRPGDYVLINTLRTQNFYVNLLHRHLAVPQFEIVYYTAYHRNVFDYRELDRFLRAGNAKIIVQPKNRKEGHFRANIPDNYAPIDSTHAVVVWKRLP